MKKHGIARLCAFGLSACICMTGSVWASATEAPEEETKVVADAKEQEGCEYAFTNNTGEDLSFLKIYEVGSEEDPATLITRIQEALIEQKFLDGEADGSFGPMSQAAMEAFCKEKKLEGKSEKDPEVLTALFGSYDEGNLLTEEGLKKGETFVMTLNPEAEDDKEKEAGEDAAEEVKEFQAVFRTAGEEEKEYTLHLLPQDSAQIEIMVSTDGIAYIQYIVDGGTEAVSTLDDEISLTAASQARNEYANYATYGDDGGYSDYGYSDYTDYSDYSNYTPTYEVPAAPAIDTSWINQAQGNDDCADLGAMGATW